MTPADFRAALATLGLTQAELAARLKLGLRTVNRYAADGSSIPEPVAMALRAMVAPKEGK